MEVLNENLMKLKSENEKLVNKLKDSNVQDPNDIRSSEQMVYYFYAICLNKFNQFL